MGKRRFYVICSFFLLAAALCLAQAPKTETEIWQTAVALRTKSITFAPSLILYEYYHIDKEGRAGLPETGCIGLAYNEAGKAAISVVWAKRNEVDYTAERGSRLEKMSSKRSEFLQYFTPFDPDLQDAIKRSSGLQIFQDGRLFWQYQFSLPLDRRRSFTGIARVEPDGSPYDYSFTLTPKPFFMDMMDVSISFDSSFGYLTLGKIDFLYEASFLFWRWKGGGSADFDGYKWISAPPRLH